MNTDTVIESLNAATRADELAMLSLLRFRCECNAEFAAHPTIQVMQEPLVDGERYTVGILGVINCVLEELGQPLIAASWSDELDGDGRAKFLGFCRYTGAKE